MGDSSRSHHHHRVVVDEIKRCSSSADQSCHDVAREERVGGAGDRPGGLKIDDAVADHAAVNGQIGVIDQGHHHRIGQRADPKLQCGTVAHDRGDERADDKRRLVRWAANRLDQLGLGIDQQVNFVGVQLGSAVAVGHPWVDLGDDERRFGDGGKGRGHADSKAVPTLRTRWAHVDDGHIDWPRTGRTHQLPEPAERSGIRRQCAGVPHGVDRGTWL